MENIKIALAIGILTTSVHSTLPMLKAIGLRNQLLTVRGLSTGIGWKRKMDVFYAELKNNPHNPQMITVVEQLCDYDKTWLLHESILDASIAPAVCGVLLKAGAKLNEPNRCGATAVHLLAQRTQTHSDKERLLTILAFFATYKPDFQVKDALNRMPADYACKDMQDHFKPRDPHGAKLKD